MKQSPKFIFYLVAPIVTVLLGIAFLLYYVNKDNGISLEHNDKINITPTQVKSIEAIGEWEFLSIDCEEMVDTISYGFFGDKELLRIYYGTLRLGVNMHEVAPKWITVKNDSIHVQLPAIKLLDTNFIDEARTKSFYEKGKWNNEAREALYNRAYIKMRKQGLTQENIATAQQNAKDQFTNLFQTMGYNKVKIDFGRR